MGKYEQLQTDIFSVFDSVEWENENIKTVPSNFISEDLTQEFIRVNIIASNTGINLFSVSGILIIDIFTSAGEGPGKASLIADALDTYLVGKSRASSDDTVTQFTNSTLSLSGYDEHNPTLYRSNYTIPFNHFRSS